MTETNKFAWKSFVALIIGFIILFSSVWFIINAYWRLTQSELTPERISHTILRLVNLARSVPAESAAVTFRYVIHPGIKINFSRERPHGMMPIFIVNLNTINKEILANPTQVHLTYPLSSDIYMHIHTHIVRPMILKLQFLAAMLVWLAALLVFCYLFIRQLSLPLAFFIKGASRFAQDINSPPIPEIGPKSIREAFHAFNQMQINLRQLLQHRTQMLAAISHDLKTPLTRISLRLENLAPTPTSQKMQQDIIQMQEMLDSILAFAHYDHQHEPTVTVNIDALLQSICDDMQEAQQSIHYHEINFSAIANCRPLALRRAIENVINNGIKYGGQVDIYLTQKNQTLQIGICDQGMGIPETELEKVFLPFYRIDKARSNNIPGSGLGLTTARDIMRSHGGEIILQTRKAGGLQVIMILPS